jgi:hypothetical protein
MSKSAPATPEQCFMSEREAARFLGLSVRTLQGMRYRGGGPRYHKFGRSVRYTREDLITWARSTRRNSTSDSGPEPKGDKQDDPAATSDTGQESTSGDADLRSVT